MIRSLLKPDFILRRSTCREGRKHETEISRSGIPSGFDWRHSLRRRISQRLLRSEWAATAASSRGWRRSRARLCVDRRLLRQSRTRLFVDTWPLRPSASSSLGLDPRLLGVFPRRLPLASRILALLIERGPDDTSRPRLTHAPGTPRSSPVSTSLLLLASAGHHRWSRPTPQFSKPAAQPPPPPAHAGARKYPSNYLFFIRFSAGGSTAYITY